MEQWALVGLTAALAATTAYYAWQNRQMVREMHEARMAAVRPHLVLRLAPLGPTNSVARLVNAGPGWAEDLRLTLRVRGTDTTPNICRSWRSDSLPPGDHVDFILNDAAGHPISNQELADHYASIDLSGTVRDSLGRRAEVASLIDDLNEWHRLLVTSEQRYKDPPLDVLASSAAKLAKTVDQMLSRWSGGLHGIRIRTDADIRRDMEEWKQRHGERRQKLPRAEDSGQPRRTVGLAKVRALLRRRPDG